jgi:hypothetical protein
VVTGQHSIVLVFIPTLVQPSFFTDSITTGNIAQQSGGAFLGPTSLLQLDTTIITNNSAGCCYASGYGSKLRNNSTLNSMTCADIDSGMLLP